MRNFKNKIIMVGAGPGDPDLLTIKAHKLILSADVILHDDLVSNEIKSLFPHACLIFNVGKRYADGKDQIDRLRKIINLTLEYCAKGKSVIRLKGGDPMLFSKSAEEIEAFLNEGIQVELVPGITSGIAAANLNSIPLTERAISEGVMLVSGSTMNDRVDHIKSIVGWIEIGNTVLLYMGYKRFGEIREIMYTYGLSKKTPAYAVSRVSHTDEELISSAVDSLVEDAEKVNLKMPVIIMLGQKLRVLK